ncbi:hypothetical protein AS032_31440 [Rhodococcus qingshengii]|nr:hypothetical protein AS032_31440 [Rhodococcus qingshengii]
MRHIAAETLIYGDACIRNSVDAELRISAYTTFRIIAFTDFRIYVYPRKIIERYLGTLDRAWPFAAQLPGRIRGSKQVSIATGKRIPVYTELRIYVCKMPVQRSFSD